MIQSLHILRKDARHLWPELTVYAALLTAFWWVVPQTWDHPGATNPMIDIVATLLKVLIPILWLVLIARLVHEESLVGDRQFWITRPYSRLSLLAAKLLFVLVLVVLPFAIIQWFLLLHAGLHPLAAMPAQISSYLRFGLYVWLPFLVVAAVTSTLQRTFMTVLGGMAVYIAALTFLSGRSLQRTMPLPFYETGALVFGTLLIGILLYQYVIRHTARSRIALVATLVLFLMVLCCSLGYMPAPLASILIRHFYPESTNPSLSLKFDLAPLQNQIGKTVSIDNLTALDMPLRLDGLGPTEKLKNPAMSFTLDAPNDHYASPWRSAGLTKPVRLFVPQDAVDRFHGQNLQMHITFVADRFTSGASQIVTAADRFSVANGGVCGFPENGPGNIPICSYPFRTPPDTNVTGAVTLAGSMYPVPSPCVHGAATRPGDHDMRNVPAGTTPDPVVQDFLTLGGPICPGTTLTFTTYQPAGRIRLETTLPPINLDDYVVHTGLTHPSANHD